MKTYSPLDTLQNVLERWWLVALLMVWGGLVAWVFHRTRPPVYEAQAIFNVSVDFTQTGELPPYEVDLAVWGAAGVMLSTPVMERTVASAQALGISVDLPEFTAMTHLERKLARFLLSVRHPDPQVAAALVNLWAQEAFDSLSDARQHAWLAQALQGHLADLGNCLQAATAPEGQSPCPPAGLPEIQEAIQTTTLALQEEQLASLGLLPAVVFNLEQTALPPDRPVLYGLNDLVLAGGLIGFLIGALIVELRLPERSGKDRRRG